MGESNKIRDRVLCYLEGKEVLDLGCGDEKIVPWAVGVDSAEEHAKCPAAVDIQARVDPDSKDLLTRIGNRQFDVVFSSHTLEHIRAPILETLNYWLLFVKSGGRMILYLPEENIYRYDPDHPKLRNPAHKHFLTQETFEYYLDQLFNVEVELLTSLPLMLYSFLVVLKKR